MLYELHDIKAPNANRNWRFIHVLVAILVLLLVTLQGCYKSKVSFQSSRGAVHPLPDKFMVYGKDVADIGVESRIFVGQKKGDRYSIESHPGLEKVRFMPFDRDANQYWAEVVMAGDSGSKEYLNILVSIEGRVLKAYNSFGASVDSYKDLEKKFKEEVTSDSTIEQIYTIYDLDNAAHKAVAYEIAAKLEAEEQDEAEKADQKTYHPDINQNSWAEASSSLRQKVTSIDAIDDVLRLSRNAKIEVLDLLFYQDTQLVRVHDSWKPANLFLYYLFDGESLTRLNGTSTPIHTFNKANTLELTEDTVVPYLWFFGFFVRGDEGPFLVFDSLADSFVPKGFKPQEKNQIAEKISPTTCRKAEGSFRCDTNMLYSNAVFGADMKVLIGGKVEMLSDAPIVADLSVKIDAPISLRDVKKDTVSPANTEPEAIQETTRSPSNWTFREELDPITDKKKQYVFGWPVGQQPGESGPFLRIGCYGSNDTYPMGITFYWGTPLSAMFPDGEVSMARITTRFGDQDAMELGWSVSDDWRSAYPPTVGSGLISQLGGGLMSLIVPGAAVSKTNFTWKAKQLHFNILNSPKIVFRAYPRSGMDATLIFDNQGYAAAVEQFSSHCNRL